MASLRHSLARAMARLSAWLLTSAEPAVVAAPEIAPTPRRALRINPAMLSQAGAAEVENPFRFPAAAPGVIPAAAKKKVDMAMDSAYAFAGEGLFAEGLAFPGYTYLAELTQRPEYRRPSEIIAKEMTRKWIKLQSTGKEGDDKSEALQTIEAEMIRLGVQAAFREAAEHDGFFGRAQIYIDVGVADNDTAELLTPLSESVNKIGLGALKRLISVEPTWTYPGQYNSTNALSENYFKPTSWYVMGTEVHASRMITIISREMPDIMKPAYSFGGLSLTQMCKPYVDNWLRTRQSVSDLVHSFSVTWLKTNLTAELAGASDGVGVFERMALFNKMRDNRGALVIDKDSEEFGNVSIPLGSLDKLQAQAQEHMSAVTGIPLVKLLGITPSGLNASSDGELRCFYDWILAQQEGVFRKPLQKVINVIQLSKLGSIDPEITFEFEPLWTLDEAAIATVRKTEAETDASLIDKGVIDPLESRTRLATQPDSPYANLDLNKVIEPPAPPPGPGFPGAPGGDPNDPDAGPGGPDGTATPGEAGPKPGTPDQPDGPDTNKPPAPPKAPIAP